MLHTILSKNNSCKGKCTNFEIHNKTWSIVLPESNPSSGKFGQWGVETTFCCTFQNCALLNE